MKKLGTTIKQAVYGQNYIADFGSKTFWQATGHIAILLLIQVIIFAIVLWTPVIGMVKEYLSDENVTAFIEQYIPEGESIIITDGKVSTETGEPIYVPFSEELMDKEIMGEPLVEGGEQSQWNYFFVVDPDVSENALRAKESYRTVALMTQDALLVTDEDAACCVS
jgi:hypothetical protein